MYNRPVVVNQGTPQPPQQPAQPPQRPSRESDAPVVVQQAPVVAGRYQFRTAAWIWFACGVIEFFLAANFLLLLFGASSSSGFVAFIYDISGVFAAPFHGIWQATSNPGSYLDPALLAAMVVYAIVAWALIRILKIVGAPHGTKPAA